MGAETPYSASKRSYLKLSEEFLNTGFGTLGIMMPRKGAPGRQEGAHRAGNPILYLGVIKYRNVSFGTVL
jgi:hypothetical protein